MTSSELPNVFLLQFAPEQWTPLRKFRYFLGPPLPPDGNVRSGLRDCEQHLDKVEAQVGQPQRLLKPLNRC